MKRRTPPRRRLPVALLFGAFLLLFFLLAFGLHRSGEKKRPPESIELTIAQERVYARAMEQYICPCGSCNERLSDCDCATALRIQKDVRRRLVKERAAYEDLVWLLEHAYRARKRST